MVPSSLGQNLLEKLLHHLIDELLWSDAVQLDHLLSVRVVRVDRAELLPAVSEQNHKVLRLRPRYLLQRDKRGRKIRELDQRMSAMQHRASMRRGE